MCTSVFLYKAVISEFILICTVSVYMCGCVLVYMSLYVGDVYAYVPVYIFVCLCTHICLHGNMVFVCLYEYEYQWLCMPIHICI